MFTINNEDKTITATRGDICFFSVGAMQDGEVYMFQPGEVVRFKVYGKKDANTVVLQKDFPVYDETNLVDITLTERDTRFGGVISKPTDYWYEIELNPDDAPQTIIGYDDDGAKVFKLFPEGKDLEGEESSEDGNPPMLFNVEYRTTERWNGNAVYTKLVDYGKQVDGAFLAAPDGATRIIKYIATFGQFLMPVGEKGDENYAYVVSAFPNVGLTLKKNGVGDYTTCVQFWYIKD